MKNLLKNYNAHAVLGSHLTVKFNISKSSDMKQRKCCEKNQIIISIEYAWMSQVGINQIDWN